MTEKNIVTSMKVRAIERNKIAVVITHKNGERTGGVMTAGRAVELIDDLELS
jgi:precorrin-6B methylase 2